MLVSISWLKEYVDINMPGAELAEMSAITGWEWKVSKGIDLHLLGNYSEY